MACGAKFEEAVKLASQELELSVGCHVLLVDAFPLLELQQVSSLAIANSGNVKFRDSLVHFACLAAARRLNEDEIEAEITAQIRKLQAVGIQVSHLDSHKHTHMFPVVFKPMLRAAKKCGVRAVRNPRRATSRGGKPLACRFVVKTGKPGGLPPQARTKPRLGIATTNRNPRDR